MLCCLDLLGRAYSLYASKPQAILIARGWAVKERKYRKYDVSPNGSLLFHLLYFLPFLYLSTKDFLRW